MSKHNIHTLDKRNTLVRDLQSAVIECVFEDAPNGKRYALRFTLRPDMLPARYLEEKKTVDDFHEANPTVIAAWDINAKRWRSFDAEAVIYAQDVNENY